MSEDLQAIAIDQIHRGRYQPRRYFDESALDELTESIRRHGVAQPIVVREGEGGYELIAGERRWRASQRAGLEDIPAVVRQLDDQATAELSLIENVQREDLNPVEEAEAYARMTKDFGYTQGQVATSVGVSRTHIAHRMRLLETDPEVQDRIRQGELSAGIGKVLAGLDRAQQRNLAAKAVKHEWTVRRLNKEVGQGEGTGQQGQGGENAWLEQRLSEHVGSPVTVENKPNGGYKLAVDAPNLEVLEGVLAKMGFDAETAE